MQKGVPARHEVIFSADGIEVDPRLIVWIEFHGLSISHLLSLQLAG